MSVHVCLLASSKLEQPVTHGAGRRGWADGGAVPVLLGFVNVCVLVTLESVVCVPSLANCSLNQLKSRMETWLSVLMFYVSPIYRCC